MRKLRVGVIDFITKSPNRSMWSRVMHANLQGIMPQVVSKWTEDEGHEVDYFIFTGFENLASDVPKDIDLVFINAFTQSAIQAYALSAKYRKHGVVTVLGGPHARCYPEDAVKYFDYVLGLTDKELIRDVLQDCSHYYPTGQHLSAKSSPKTLPGVRERWKYISKALEKATPLFRVVPMIGSLGCPYTCSFCIDASEAYQPLEFEALKEDLRFVRTKIKRPLVSWYDPNFGVRFNDYMNVIEEAVPKNSIDFIAESSLSILSEPHLKRLRDNGFQAVLPGIESWFDMGNKSKTGSKQGIEKVKVVSEHINLILSYIPYMQANFVVGLDSDNGAESYELTKRFVDLSPAAFPAYPLITAFGRAAPLNLEYQKDNRVLGFPFHFLNNNHASNVVPKNYTWPEFYDLIIDLARYTYSWRAIYHRFRTTRTTVPRWMNFMRAISTEGSGRIKFYKNIRRMLDEDRKFRDYFEQETDVIPDFYINMMKKDLGPLWEYLPDRAYYHDPYAYLKSETEKKNGAAQKEPSQRPINLTENVPFEIQTDEPLAATNAGT